MTRKRRPQGGDSLGPTVPSHIGADGIVLDRRLLDALAGQDGPGGVYPPVGALASSLGYSLRHVRRRLAALEAAGLVERVPVFEVDDDPEWRRRGDHLTHRRRQTSNTYRLAGRPPPDVGHPRPPGHDQGTPAPAKPKRSRARGRPAAQLELFPSG